ncbi:ASCH domain-containing protein, partial [Enterococcus faecium]
MYQQVEEYVKKVQEKYPSIQSEKLRFFSFGITVKKADEVSELDH